VPFERPTQFGDREELTNEEFAQLKAQAARQLEADNADFDIDTADTSNAGAPGSATSPPPHWFERGTPSRRTSMVISPRNGRLPPRVESSSPARGRGGNTGAGNTLNSWLDVGLFNRCITYGVPNAIFPAAYNANTRIVQAPGVVAITYEMIHETRVIPLDSQLSLPATHRQYVGQSRGHWQGETLVVESSNFRPESRFRGASPDAKIVERLTLVDGGTLRYEVTVNDPATWTAPWTAALNLKAQGDDMYEYACHEGNYSLRNMLSGARALER
jgi:hypothetical protein